MSHTTRQQVKEAVQKAGLSFVEHHKCSLCDVPVGYVVHGDEVAYKSSCGCSWAPDRPVTWDEVAGHINRQTRNDPKYGDVAACVAAEFGLTLPDAR